jgi:hypothetical protein
MHCKSSVLIMLPLVRVVVMKDVYWDCFFKCLNC